MVEEILMSDKRQCSIVAVHKRLRDWLEFRTPDVTNRKPCSWFISPWGMTVCT